MRTPGVLRFSLPLGLALVALSAVPAYAVDDQAALKAADAASTELEPTGSTESVGTQFQRYQQEVDGVPVLGSEAVVAQADGEKPELVGDSSAPGIESPAPAQITKRQAVTTARGGAKAQALRAPIRATLAIDPESAGGRQVWRVQIPSKKPLADFEVLVDAATGAVISSEDVMQHVQGRAKIFLLSPPITNGGLTGLADNKDRDSALLTALRTAVDLKHLRKNSKCLEGAYVRAFRGFDNPVCSARRRWGRITRADERFEPLNVYFHADRTISYVRALGFTKGIGYKRLPLRTNAIPEDNSGFSSFTRDVTFGSGGVDDGEDGDIAVHEYGHSLQDSQVPEFGMTPDGGAMGEGFTDYLAAVMTLNIPGSSAEAQACIFEWDAVGIGQQCLRRTDTAATLASVTAPPCLSEIHCAGELWSATLWSLRFALGSDASGLPAMDRIVLQSHFSLTPKATLPDGANALLLADDQLYGGVHRPAITAELTARGLLPPPAP